MRLNYTNLRTYKKRLKKTWLWVRIRQVRLKRWWLQNDKRYGLRWRVANTAAAALMLAAVVIPVLQNIVKNNGYELSADTLKLVGSTDPNLEKQLTYDAKAQTYRFNKDAIKSTDASTNPLAAMKAQVGTADGQGNNKNLYALDVPQNISSGVTYHDVNSGLSFSLVPQFTAQHGQEEQGHLVFPLGGGTQAIYTLKNNGLKEDIVVQKASEDTMTFSYKLNLPDTLQAKVIPNSDGAIGVYSGDPTLFGDISYGSDADRAAVEKARVKADKNYLVFGLPSPVIKTLDGSTVGDARFQLDGDQLSVMASGLLSVNSPVTIDPSVVVTSTSDFQNGNAEDSIDFNTSGQIARSGVAGGSLTAWHFTHSSTDDSTTFNTGFTTPRYSLSVAAYNGYLYVANGDDGSNTYGDVQYAPLNSNGTIGAWNAPATNTFSNPRTAASLVAYDGYLYILGGWSTNPLNNVQYSLLNTANGSPGPWAATSSFITGRDTFGVAAYNGYMYIAGGCTTTLPCSGTVADVQYAPINASGTLGSWHYTHNSTDDNTTFVSGFSAARYGLSLVVYNGFMYVLGGCTTNTNGGLPLYACTGTYKADTQYAPINSNGTIGTWTTSATSFTTGRNGQTAVAVNGYMYIMGGYSGSFLQDTQYAPINANGTLGAWQSTASFSTTRALFAAVTYNGYLYIAGGAHGTSATTCSPSSNIYCSDVQYTPIDPAGQTQTWTNPGTPAFSAARASACSVAYNGYLYVIGGSTDDSSANNVKTVSYATVSSSGTIGTWTNNTTSLPQWRSQAGCVAANGYLYLVGGLNATSGSATGTPDGAVLYTTLDVATGAPGGSWTTGASMTALNANFTPVNGGVFIYNGFIYSVGGTFSSGASASNALGVYYATVNAGTGAVGTWSTTNNLNLAYQSRAFALASGYVYAMGGTDGTLRNTVEYAQISSGGGVGSWSTTATLPSAISFNHAATINGCIYSVGGKNGSGTSQSAVYYACPSSNGTIGSWHTAPSLAVAMTDLGVASYNGYLFAAGGDTSGTTVLASVETTSVNNGGPGTIGTWGTTGSAIGALSGQQNSATINNGYMYLQSGDTTGGGSKKVYYASFNPDGTVGTWNLASAGSMNDVRNGHNPMIACNGYMYAISGGTGGTYDMSTEYAPINSNGSLGTWTLTTASLSATNQARQFANDACYNNTLYFIGGTGSTGDSSEVDYAAPTASGDITSWSTTTSLPAVNHSPGAFAYNGYLYVVGGNTSSTYYTSVIYAPINNSNGTLGSWLSTTSLTTGQSPEVTAYNGYVYIDNGWNGACMGTSGYAAINSDGTIGNWQVGPTLSATNCDMTSAYNGYLYNASTSAGFQGRLSYAPLSVIDRAGHYSKLIDLGAGVRVTGIGFATTSGNAVSSSAISYRPAGTDGIFDTSLGSTNASNAVCANGMNSTRYVWVSVALDDSYGSGTGGAFPDANGTNANLADLIVNFSTSHPASSIRLRGGQTLQAGALGALDTCIDFPQVLAVNNMNETLPSIAGGYQAGDLILHTVLLEPANQATGSASYGTPVVTSGFTLLSGTPVNSNDTHITNQNTSREYIEYKWATGSETAGTSVAMTGLGSDVHKDDGTIVIRGLAGSGTPFAEQATGSGTTNYPSLSLTLGDTNSLLMYLGTTWDADLPSLSGWTSITAPSGTTTILYQNYAASGSTGSIAPTSPGGAHNLHTGVFLSFRAP